MAEKKVDFKSMSKQKKKEYIWEYYRYHIIIGTIVLVYAITSMVQNFNSITYPYQLILLGGSSYSDYDALSSFEEKLTEIAIPEHGKKEAAKAQLYALEKIETTTDPMISAYLQKFIIQVAAKELDVVLLNEADFDYFYDQEMFAELNEINGLALDGVNSERYVMKDDNIYGIRLNKSILFESINYRTDNKILTIVSNAKHNEENIAVANWILEQCK